jgi:DNA-binding NtrC family response regulator
LSLSKLLGEKNKKRLPIKNRRTPSGAAQLFIKGNYHAKKFLSESIVGNSKAIRKIIHKLAQAPSTTVLLMGARGSGKNIAVRVIHYSSMPAEAPFVEINCAARTQL